MFIIFVNLWSKCTSPNLECLVSYKLEISDFFWDTACCNITAPNRKAPEIGQLLLVQRDHI